MKRKLIRDSLAKWIIENDQTAKIRQVDDPEEIMELLRLKILEEAEEVVMARHRADAAEEIADLREVLLELMARWNISEGDVASAMITKRMSKGVFKEGYVLYDYDNRPKKDINNPDEQLFINQDQ